MFLCWKVLKQILFICKPWNINYSLLYENTILLLTLLFFILEHIPIPSCFRFIECFINQHNFPLVSLFINKHCLIPFSKVIPAYKVYFHSGKEDVNNQCKSVQLLMLVCYERIIKKNNANRLIRLFNHNDFLFVK